MGKILGYTKENGKDWFPTSHGYTDDEIEAINDPEGGSEVSTLTAIPSPFALMDLVKTAFLNIAQTPSLTSYSVGNNIIATKNDEKLVSYCLDLIEILFNIDTLKDKIKIIVWNKTAEIKKLSDGEDGHRKLSEALELYLTQDEQAYNFDLLQRLYLIEYEHKIIGCTSPVTICFSSANDLSHAQIKLTRNDVTFGSKYISLYKRDKEFQKYLYLLFLKYPKLTSKMSGFNNYLEKNREILDRNDHPFYLEIEKLQANQYLTNYSELDTGVKNDNIEVIGFALRKRKKNDGPIESDFTITSTKYGADIKPLVLQNKLTKPFRYINDTWDSATNVPYVDNEPTLEKRWLPGLKIQYPYLTVSDFLEPYLIRLVYPINKENFFDGNLKIEVGNNLRGYLLPIKKKFFGFFDSGDLLSSLEQKPKIEIIQGAANAIKVILSIPIVKEGEYIHFERTYYPSPENSVGQPKEEENRGIIVQHEFGVTLFPFIKTNDPDIIPFYRVQLIDRDIAGVMKNTEYLLSFFANSSNEQITTPKKVRSNKQNGTATSQYYVVDREFDFIQVTNLIGSGASGIIIPDWKPIQAGHEAFTFAVDFGTTNTHIEYKTDNSPSKAFDINSDEVQIATLFDPKNTPEDFGGTSAIPIRELIDYEFVPQTIGKESDYKFPQRTVLSESQTLNLQTQTFILADFNIPFVYEKKREKDVIHSNLKWARKVSGNEKRVRAFFEELVMLMRNKVILKGGDLKQTKLIWFYPSSMKEGRKSDLQEAWEELFKFYFKSDKKPIGITESLAPYFYFKDDNRVPGSPAVSIDIGGGTTDVVVFEKKKPVLLTSFKFAANAIFGDGYSSQGSATSNGLIGKYLPYFEKLFSENKLADLSGALSSIVGKQKSEDLNAFFFSVENNPRITDRRLFSYSILLSRNENLKILFLYFYCAIIYHIASLMKKKQFELPKHLVFSGTGSKILNIISNNPELLAGLTKEVFKHIYRQDFDKDGLSIVAERNIPKEVTCKGVLRTNAEELDLDVAIIKSTLSCVKSVDSLTYGMLNNDVKKEILACVTDFNSFFTTLSSQYRFDDRFNVSVDSINIFNENVDKHLKGYLEEGLEFNNNLDAITDVKKEVEETLFFYPLIGSINHLITELSKLKDENED